VFLIIEFTKTLNQIPKWLYFSVAKTTACVSRSKIHNCLQFNYHISEIQLSPPRTMATMEDRAQEMSNLFYGVCPMDDLHQGNAGYETDQLQLLQYDPAQMIEMNIPVLSNRLFKNEIHIMFTKVYLRQIIKKAKDELLWFYGGALCYSDGMKCVIPYMIESKLTKWLNRNNISWDHSLSGSLQIRLTCVYLMWRFFPFPRFATVAELTSFLDMYENTRIYIHIFLLSCKCSVNDDSITAFVVDEQDLSDYVTEINRLY
jgi:hypothetical protein